MQSQYDSPPRPPEMTDWMYCEEIARQHGRSFYLASRVLPPARQRGVLATYAYCRIADDIVDETSGCGHEATAQALQDWAFQLKKPNHPVAVVFAYTRDRYSIPEQPVHDLLLGVEMDLRPGRYATWAELRTYCYHVAGTVGLMVAPIFGCRDSRALRHAADLGIAMQLTNILRDIAEDAHLGRIYLPQDEIEAFGCDFEAMFTGHPGKGFRELMAFQIDRARRLYASALEGVYALSPSGRFATLTASRLYSGILNEIEALDYDVYRMRAIVPASRKLRSVAGASTDFLLMSMLWREQATSPDRWKDIDPAPAAAAHPQAFTDLGSP